jgi:hypothetical protein
MLRHLHLWHLVALNIPKLQPQFVACPFVAVRPQPMHLTRGNVCAFAFRLVVLADFRLRRVKGTLARSGPMPKLKWSPIGLPFSRGLRIVQRL